MLEPLYTTSDSLDPMIREYRVSFLMAIKTLAPSVLRDLESVFLRRLSPSVLERALREWAQDHRLYFWVIEIAHRTMDRWERQPTMSRTTWKLPRVRESAVWDDAPGFLPSSRVQSALRRSRYSSLHCAGAQTFRTLALQVIWVEPMGQRIRTSPG